MEHLSSSGVDATVDVKVAPSGAQEITLGGELDISNVDALRTSLQPLLDQGPDRVVFDLRELRFMDSSGIAVLLEVAQRVPTVEIREPTPVIKRVIEATGLSEILRIV